MFKLNKEENKPKKLKMKTPATTIVEECKSEDTGVGLSMALGNQEQKTVIDDLANTPKKNLKKSPLRLKN